jgi:hypothetical protein
MVSSNVRIQELADQIAELQRELDNEKHGECPRCGSDHYLLIDGNDKVPPVRRCYECRYPNEDATAYTFTTHKQLLASLPKADKYDITIYDHGRLPENEKNKLQEGVAMTTLATMAGKAAYHGPVKGWEIWWEDANGKRFDELPDMPPEL